MNTSDTSIRHFTHEEIAAMKMREAQMYEKMRSEGTRPPSSEYRAEPQPNRRERRKQIAIARGV